MTTRRGTCKGCGGPVLWVQTEATGKWLSLDPEPVPNGNVVIRSGKAHVLTKWELAAQDDLFEPEARRRSPRHVAHRATCTSWPASNKR